MFNLTLLQLFPLLSMFFVLSLGFIVLNSNKTIKGWLFFLISIVFAMWTFGSFKMFTDIGNSSIIFWDRFIYLGVVFMPALQYHFALTMTHINKERKILLSLSYLLSFIFLILSRTDYFVSGIFKYKWGVHMKAHLFHHLFLIFFFFYIFALLEVFYKQYKQSAIKVEKQKLHLLITSFTILNIVGGLGYLPAYNIPFYSPISLLAPLLFSILTGYTILKYRLMDIRIIFRRIFIYLGLSLFIYLIIALWGYFSLNTFKHYPGNFYSTGILISLISVSSIYILRNLLEKFANKYFFFNLYNYQQTINNLSKELNHQNNLDEILTSIINTIKNVFRLNHVGVLLLDETKTSYEIAKIIGFNKNNCVNFVQNNFLMNYLQKNKNSLIKDELILKERETKQKEKKENLKKLYKHMKNMGVSICLPLMSKDELIGIIMMGEKISNDSYTKEDLELLDTLINQAGIAIDNARLYKNIKLLNETLKQRVLEQTKDIRKKARELSKKNRSLEELLNMKSDFLRVVNHQLNTPISIMKNSLFMVNEGSFTKEKGLKFITAGLKRIDETINDFWNAFALEGETIKMNAERTDIERIIKMIIEEKENSELIKKRGLTLTFKTPDFKTPIAFCDSRQIIQAISNILDNAINYTPTGSIKITITKSEKNLTIHITDTGSGISKEDKRNLFKKFSRGSRATKFYANGSGLGLYIANKIIEANNGKLELEDTVLDGGSTFAITVPIHINQETYIGKENKLLKARLAKRKKKKKKQNILFLEDEQNFSNIYSNYFTKNGYKFHLLTDTDDAIKNIRKIKPNIIISDIIIPEKEKDGSISNIVAEKGWDFIRRIKRNRLTKNIPIFILTNLNSEKDREKARRLKVNGYIIKNEINPAKLLEIIRTQNI